MLPVLLAPIPVAARSDTLRTAEVDLIEVIAAAPLTRAERDAVRSAADALARAHPVDKSAEASTIALAAKVRHGTPLEQALFRERAMRSLGERDIEPTELPLLATIVRHNPVLAYHGKHPTALTERALGFYFLTLDRTATLFGLPKLTPLDRNAMRGRIVTSFSSMPIAERDALVAAESRDIVYENWIRTAGQPRLADAMTLYAGHVSRETLPEVADSLVGRIGTDTVATP